MAIGVINHGRRYDKPRPSLYETTGNEIYRHGQRNLRKSLCFSQKASISFFFFCMRIYIYAYKKKNQYLIAGRPPKSRFFLQ